MEQIKRAAEAVAVPSRAKELKAEMERAELEDLMEAYRRAHNNGQKRRLRKEMKQRYGVVPA